MSGSGMIQVFDGHNDTILSLAETGRSFFERSDTGHVDLPRAQAGGMCGGFYAVWVPDPAVKLDPTANANASPYSGDVPPPPMMSTGYAQAYTLDALGRLMAIAKASQGKVAIVRTVAELKAALAAGQHAMELHLEGAEAIDKDLVSLEVFYAAGVRSIGLVWSRENIFGHGVPFKFGTSPDTGPGLTDAGKALVRACNELGILLDVSHLNEAGFWDLAKVSSHPIVATHSCVHAISAATRNLTDKQLDAIKDSDGIVGVNYATGFLSPTGDRDPANVPAKILADHVDYLVKRIGIDRVALGSDYDGAGIPGDIKDVAGQQVIIQELRSRGYDDAALNKIGTGNWIRIFEKTWKA
jgi:membrane dipeptidase